VHPLEEVRSCVVEIKRRDLLGHRLNIKRKPGVDSSST